LISIYNNFIHKNISEQHKHSITFHFIRKWISSRWKSESLQSYFQENLGLLSRPFASLIISYISHFQSQQSSQSNPNNNGIELDLLSVFSGEFLMKVIEDFIFQLHSTPSENGSNSESIDSKSKLSLLHKSSKSNINTEHVENGENKSKSNINVENASSEENGKKRGMKIINSTFNNGVKLNETANSTNNQTSQNTQSDPISQANSLLSHEEKLWIGIKENMEKDISKRHKSLISIPSSPDSPSLSTVSLCWPHFCLFFVFCLIILG
jgi:hypothetical protein